MSGRLTGKTAVVTGGSSGIGKAIVTLFAQEGARVACVASADRAKAQAVADAAGKVAGEIKPFFADLSRWNEAERLIGEVNNAFGSVDILVTAAGLFIPTPIGTRAQADTEHMVAVNLLGTIATIDAVVPIMKKRGSGKIVSIASIAGLVGIGNYGTYCATKAGVIGLVKTLAIELAPFGININAIAPGNTETPINEDIRTNPALRHVYDLMKSRTPSKRAYSKPEDMAKAALYLASEDSVAMYGSTMVLDEGLIAGL
jgi:3-oxoacyl-[acyl-carrier protein] reductase